MTDFARTARQNAIWDRIQAIRYIIGDGALQSPDEAGYDEDDGELEIEYQALITEYNAIHTENETKG